MLSFLVEDGTIYAVLSENFAPSEACLTLMKPGINAGFVCIEEHWFIVCTEALPGKTRTHAELGFSYAEFCCI